MLSLSKGIVHPYYVSALGPGVAAMVGAGVFAFARFARRSRLAPAAARRRGRGDGAGAARAAAPRSLHVVVHRAADRRRSTLLLVVVLSLVPPCAGSRPARSRSCSACCCVAPAVYSASNWLAPVQSTFPAAGPAQAAAGPGGYGVNDEHVKVDRALLRYVESHRPGTRWSVLTDASNTASPMILLGGRGRLARRLQRHRPGARRARPGALRRPPARRAT